jgi:hypothetical protein
MYRKNKLLSVIVVLVLLTGALGCPMGVGTPSGMGPMMKDANTLNLMKPFSVVYEINYDNEAFPHITIYYNVPYSGLTFEKVDSLYSSSFTLTFNIKHEGETIINKSLSEKLKMTDYSKTTSEGESFFGTFKENISTGKNEILLLLMDKNSDRRYVWKRKILVPEVSDTLRKG